MDTHNAGGLTWAFECERSACPIEKMDSGGYRVRGDRRWPLAHYGAIIHGDFHNSHEPWMPQVNEPCVVRERHGRPDTVVAVPIGFRHWKDVAIARNPCYDASMNGL